MTRKLAAVPSALALALCFARAAAWAAPAGAAGAHDCCGRSAPAKAPTLSECCAPALVAGAVRLVRVDAPATIVAAPAVLAAAETNFVVAFTGAPPGVRTYRATSPARAPPLA